MHTSPPVPDTALLDRYLAGEADFEERQVVERWLARHPGEHTLLATIRTGVGDPYGAVPPYNVEARAAAIVDYSIRLARRLRRQPVDAGTTVARHLFRHGDNRRPLGLWYGVVGVVAATTILIVGSVGIARQFGQHRPSAMTTYTTANGHRATISLADGSTVLLNVASRLEVPTDYAAGNRTVRLSGEAMFTVTHSGGEPFTVLAGATVTRVLGTSFVVRRYRADTATVVAVREGKVSVGTVVVTAAHLAEVERTGLPRIRSADPSIFAFTTGNLTLNDLSLPDAIPELNRWYDADIRLGAPTLASYRLGGEITAGSLAELAENLERALSVRVVQSGRILTLYPIR